MIQLYVSEQLIRKLTPTTVNQKEGSDGIERDNLTVDTLSIMLIWKNFQSNGKELNYCLQ